MSSHPETFSAFDPADYLNSFDDVVAYLQGKGVATLHETPRHRPEFTGDPAQTYYQVMFVSPDGIQFEIVYTGPKA